MCVSKETYKTCCNKKTKVFQNRIPILFVFRSFLKTPLSELTVSKYTPHWLSEVPDCTNYGKQVDTKVILRRYWWI